MLQEWKTKSALVVVALSLLLAACKKEESAVVAPPAPKELRVFTWSSYLIPEVIAEFEKENKAKVITDYFSSND